MARVPDLKRIYNIEQKSDRIILRPKEKSLIKFVEVFYLKDKIPFRMIVEDQLGFQSLITLKYLKKNNIQEKNFLEYPKTVEVIDHVRHSVI